MAVNRLEDRIADQKIRWYFTKEELEHSPSRQHGVDFDKELSYRQQTANMIQEMGHRLKLNQICTATAIVYMHRFFMVHSFRSLNRWHIAAAALFLAAKVEEQPQKLEYVARVFHICINRDSPNIDSNSDTFTKLVESITTHELLILETLGFDLAVQHAHPHVVKCTQLVRASKDLSQTAYFMAHNSLLLTTFCLEHRPTVVACCCINLACVWKGIEIPPSQDQKAWWEYVDPDINQELLDSLTKEFLDIYGKCPSKLQKKINEQIKLAQKQNKLKQGESSSSQVEKGKGPAQEGLHLSTTSSSKSSRLAPPNQSHKPVASSSSSHHHTPHLTHGSHPAQLQDNRSSKHLQLSGSSASKQSHSAQNISAKPARQNLYSQQVGKGSTASLSSSSNKSQPMNKIAGMSSHVANNKVVSKLQEGHRALDGATRQQQQHGVLHKHQVMSGSRGSGEKHRMMTGEQKSKSSKHVSEHHNHDSHMTSRIHHHNPHPQHTKPSKRPHLSSNELSDKKRLKLDSQLQPPLPPLPPMSSEDAPPPPPPQNYSHDYSSSLPPLPPYPPPRSSIMVHDRSPPPPPP